MVAVQPVTEDRGTHSRRNAMRLSRGFRQVARASGRRGTVGPAVEAMEPRLLLSGDWLGTWSASGYMMEAEPGRAVGLTAVAQKQTLILSDDGAAGYLLDVPGAGVQFALTVHGDELWGQGSGPADDGGYSEYYIRMKQVADGAAVFLYGEGVFDSAAKNDLWDSSSFAGLATRGAVALAAPVWGGQYLLDQYEIDVDGTGGAGQVTVDYSSDLAVYLADLGGGAYLGGQLNGGGDDQPGIFRKSGAALYRNDGGWSDFGDYYQDYEWLLPGPNGTACIVGAEAGFDQPHPADLWWADFWVGVVRPMAITDDAPGMFDAASDVITNPWLGLANVGDGYALSGTGNYDGATRTYGLIGRETVGGVKCLILNVSGWGQDPAEECCDLYVAQDTSGDLRVLKITGIDSVGDSVFWQAGALSESLLLAPAAPAVGPLLPAPPGQDWWVEATGQHLDALATGAGPFDGCTVLGTLGDGRETYAWQAPAQGVVYEEWYDDGGGALLGTWQRTGAAPVLADWNGAWKIGGTEMWAEIDDGAAWYGSKAFKLNLNIVRLPTGAYYSYETKYIGDGKLLRDYGGELRNFQAGDNAGGGYYESYLLLHAVDANAAVILYGEGDYDSPDMNVIWWTDAVGGLATRGKVAVTPRPWTGDYDVRGANIGIDVGSTSLDGEAFGGRLTASATPGQYLAQDIDDPGDTGGTFAETGKVLASHHEQSDEEEHAWFCRGPNDTLYCFGIDVAYDGAARTALQHASLWADVLTPRAGSQYRPDLTAAIAADAAPLVTLPGEVLKVPVTVGNLDGNAPIKGRVQLDLLLSDDDQPDAADALAVSTTLSVNIAAGAGKTFLVQVPLPPDMPGGTNYHVVAVVDAGKAVAELDETNNSAASAGLETLWKFGTFDARRSAKLVVRDAAGKLVTFSISGAGWGEVTGDGNFDVVALHGTDARSGLNVIVQKGATTTVGSIVADGSMSGIMGKQVSIRGDITVPGTLTKLQLDDVAGGHHISIAADIADAVDIGTAALSVTLDRVADAILDAHLLPIKSLTVTEWLAADSLGHDEVDDEVLSPRINSVKAKGNAALGIDGDLEAALTCDVLGTVSVAGHYGPP